MLAPSRPSTALATWPADVVSILGHDLQSRIQSVAAKSQVVVAQQRLTGSLQKYSEFGCRTMLGSDAQHGLQKHLGSIPVGL